MNWVFGDDVNLLGCCTILVSIYNLSFGSVIALVRLVLSICVLMLFELGFGVN